MGWSSGTDLVREVAHAIYANVSDEVTRIALYEALVTAAEREDWDCHNEAMGIDPVLDVVLESPRP